MLNICRFCLKVSAQEMCKLLECDILSKMKSTLSFQITIDEALPNQLCKECANKLEEISVFCSNVKENQHKLQQYLNTGCIQDYYLKLTNNVLIKEEQNENIIFCENKYLKTEDCNTNKPSEIKIKTNHRELNKNRHDINIGNNDSMKIEEYDNGNNCNETVYSTDNELTPSSIKNEKIIKTKKSQKIFKRKKNTVLPKSIDTNTDSVKQFTCLSCLQLCESQTDLIKHYHDKHFNKIENTAKKNYKENEFDGKITYKCNSCEKSCYLKKDIVRHVGIHNDERPLICKLCGRTYKMVTEIIRHARVHNGFKLQCSYKCGYSTAYHGALKDHENRHRDVYKYTCDKCGKGFHVRTWFEQHQNIHSGLKPFVCDICGLAFHMDRYLTSHRSLIHPQSSSVKRYICMHCDQKCDSANSLALHLEEHGINKEKEFLCDFCGKILSSADQLKYHHRMHSGVKPYSCSICNKTFAKKFNVKVHMTSHSGEKTHACARCGKRYSQRSALLRHLKRHHAVMSPKRND